MLQIQNETTFEADRALLLDGDGGHVWAVAVKGTYRIRDDGTAELDREQEPVAAAPLWSGEPGKSTLLRDAELVVEHPGTDVTFNASAAAPRGRPVPHVDVGVMVGPLRKLLRVFGERVWFKGMVGLSSTPPRPFERMPITWERAYGGREELGGGSFAAETRNPIGRGFATRAKSLDGKPLPNVEDVAHLVRSWNDRPEPAGLSAVPPDWSPRRERGGTYDEEWKRSRLPLWPKDYDPRFHVSAPAGLHAEKPLQGGEVVSTTGLVAEGGLTVRLPRERVVVETQVGDGWVRQPVQLERVIVEPDARRLLLVWGSRLSLGTRGREVVKSVVTTKAWTAP